MVKALIIANAANRAKVFVPVADYLFDAGAKVTFVSLDPILDGDASNILRISRHPYIEFPHRTEKNLFEMSIKERFATLKQIRKPVNEMLTSLSPDVILLGAAAYVEGVIIEEARKRGMKTALMQDGLRIRDYTSAFGTFLKWLVSKIKAIVNEWTLALYGVRYFFTPFETNRVDKILLFGDSVFKEVLHKGIRREKLAIVGNPVYDSAPPLPVERSVDVRFFFGLPPDRKIVLFGMQCFHRHKVAKIDDEIAIVKDLVDLFREIPSFDLIIKLHPENDYDMYRELFFKWNPPSTVHLIKDEFSPRELLAISDAFMTVYSTMALEALVYGIPVITLDYTPVRHRLNLEPATFSAKSSQDLKRILSEWRDDTHILIKDKVKQVLDSELANLGFASEKAAEVILDLVGKNGDSPG